jgi:signal recognition particle GTPase
MTKKEIENPELLETDPGRIGRIAKGSGTSNAEIKALLKQYALLKDMMKSQSSLEGKPLDQKTMMKFAKKFSKKMKL